MRFPPTCPKSPKSHRTTKTTAIIHNILHSFHLRFFWKPVRKSVSLPKRLPGGFEYITQQDTKSQGDRHRHPGVSGSLLAEVTWDSVCKILDFCIVLTQSMSNILIHGLYCISYQFLCVVSQLFEFPAQPSDAILQLFPFWLSP